MKYELTNQTKIIKGVYEDVILHRIRALKSFGNVKAGDLGGWIEKEENLSQEFRAWVYDNAIVMNSARVDEDAKVSGNARIYGKAVVSGMAKVCGHAEIFDTAQIRGWAKVYDKAKVYDDARVFQEAKIRGCAKIFGTACVAEHALVAGSACVNGGAFVHGRAKVYGNAEVSGSSNVFENAEVFEDACTDCMILGNAKVHGDAFAERGRICGDANLENYFDVLYVGPMDEYGSYATFMRTLSGIAVYIGGSFGFIDEIVEKFGAWHPSCAKRISLAAELAKEQIKLP